MQAPRSKTEEIEKVLPLAEKCRSCNGLPAMLDWLIESAPRMGTGPSHSDLIPKNKSSPPQKAPALAAPPTSDDPSSSDGGSEEDGCKVKTADGDKLLTPLAPSVLQKVGNCGYKNTDKS